MKISQITIENFKSYRERQVIKFSTDESRFITVLEGQMGHGKSNLLNAFYWCLFDQYWDSDKHELETSPDPDTVFLFNKGILKERNSEGEHVDILVEIEFFDDDNNKYLIKRTQSGIRRKSNWNFQRYSQLELEKRSSLDGSSKRFEGEEASAEIENFFPTSLSNYFLFRGENRTELVQLQGKGKFQNALDELSKVAVFKRSVRHLEAVRDDLRRELAEEADDELKKQIQEALANKSDAQQVLADYQKELINLQNIETQKREEYEKYRDLIKKNYQALEIKNKIEGEEGEIKRLGSQLDLLYEERRKLITRKWGALLLKDVVKKIGNRYQEAVNSGIYPPDIKNTLIDKILHDLRCICGRGIDKDSQEYELIQRLKDLGSFDHLMGAIESLMGDVARINNLLDQYPEDIRRLSQRELNLRSEMQERNIRIDGWKKKIGEISEDVDELQNKQDAAKTEQEKTVAKIKQTESLIKDKEAEIDQHERLLEECQNKLEQNKFPAIKANLADNALKEIRKLKRQYEKAIYEDLEKYTQEHWDILVYDKLNYDKIKFDSEENYFELYDIDGNPTRSILNTGHSILLVLSFISALTRIAKETWQEEYPLVMDAPTSEIGDSAIQSALTGFGKVFNQVILILKDGSVPEELPKSLQKKIGKRYWIELNKDRQHSIVELKELVYA